MLLKSFLSHFCFVAGGYSLLKQVSRVCNNARLGVKLTSTWWNPGSSGPKHHTPTFPYHSTLPIVGGQGSPCILISISFFSRATVISVLYLHDHIIVINNNTTSNPSNHLVWFSGCLSINYFSIRFVWPERIQYLYAGFIRLERYNDRIEPPE